MDIIYKLATSIPCFLLAIVVHGYVHAYVSERFGDPTPKNHGSLSFNPVNHYDLFGMVVIPAITLLMGGMMFGYPRTIPTDARYFKNIKKGVFWVNFAGPLSNIILSVFLSFFLVLVSIKVPSSFEFYSVLKDMLGYGVYYNLILAVFFLLPFPPLNGSKMVAVFLDYETQRKYLELEKYYIIFLLILMSTNIFSYFLSPAIMVSNIMFTLFHSILS